MDHLIPDFISIMVSNVLVFRNQNIFALAVFWFSIKLMRKKCISNMDTIKIQFLYLAA